MRIIVSNHVWKRYRERVDPRVPVGGLAARIRNEVKKSRQVLPKVLRKLDIDVGYKHPKDIYGLYQDRLYVIVRGHKKRFTVCTLYKLNTSQVEALNEALGDYDTPQLREVLKKN